jgi:spermidine/putrescine transport system permease protein
MNARLPRWLAAFTGLVLILMHLPVLVLIVFSFNSSKFAVTWTGFTLHWYQRLLEREDILNALRSSLIVGVAATAIATTLGTLIALALARHPFRGRTAYEGLMYVPIVTPEIVTGISLLVLFVFFRIPLGLATITIAHVAFSIPFVVVVVMARLAGMDDNLEEAAMTLGADELTAFRRITVPLLWPGILSAALLTFILSFDDFVITSFVAGSGSSTLPLVVYSMVRRNIEPSINAISTIIIVATCILLYVAEQLTRDKKSPTHA